MANFFPCEVWWPKKKSGWCVIGTHLPCHPVTVPGGCCSQGRSVCPGTLPTPICWWWAINVILNIYLITLDEELLHYHSVCVLSVGRLVAPTLADDYQEDTQEPHLHSSVPVPMDIWHGYQLVQGDENICKNFGELCTSQFQNCPCAPPPRHLTFLKNFGQILGYGGSLDGQMPHRLVLQQASTSPPTSDHSNIFPYIKPFIQK